MSEAKGRWKGPLLLVCLLLLAVGETVLLVWVSNLIGWWTLVVLIGTSIVGVALLKREWSRVWHSLTEVAKTGSWPAGRVTDATLVLLGGLLLILPGLISDLAGLLLLIPFTRAFMRSGLSWFASRTLQRAGVSPVVIRGTVVVTEEPKDHPLQDSAALPAESEVLEGEIVADEDDTSS